MSKQYLCTGRRSARTGSIATDYPPNTKFEKLWETSFSAKSGPVIVDETIYILKSQSGSNENTPTKHNNFIIGYDLIDGKGTTRIEVPYSGNCERIVSDARLLYVLTRESVIAINPKAESVQWTYDLADEAEHCVGDLVVGDEQLYVTFPQQHHADTTFDDMKWRISMATIDTTNGTGYSNSPIETYGEPVSINSTFLTYSEGMLFTVVSQYLKVDNDDYQPPKPRHKVIAMNSDGGLEWEQKVPETDNNYINFAMDNIAVDDSNIYIAPSSVHPVEKPGSLKTRSRNKTKCSVTAIDRLTGSIQWQSPLSKKGVSSISVNNGIVACWEDSHSIIALDAQNGERQWEQYEKLSKPVLSNEFAYTIKDEDLVVFDIKSGAEEHRHSVGARANKLLPFEGTLICMHAGNMYTFTTKNNSSSQGGSKLDDMQNSESMITCSNCNSSVESNSKFCSDCGEKLDDVPSCNQCGTSLSGEEKYCPNCGAAINDKPNCARCGNDLSKNQSFCPECGKETDI